MTVCTAAPQLEHALSQHATDSSYHLVPNARFWPSKVPYSTERRALPGYQEVLGANLLLSIFSYFEVYFFDLIDEIVDFHGGEEEIEKTVRRQLSGSPVPQDQAQAVAKLRKPFKSGRSERYRKFSRMVDESRVVWPSRRLMLYGLKQIRKNRKRWKSVDIPNLTLDLLVLDLVQSEIDRFHTVRNERNKIAHGSNLSYDLDAAVEHSNFLNELSRKIDDHVVSAFMIIERYVH